MAYNITSIAANATDFGGFIVSVNNELMRGQLGLLLMIGILTIIFIGLISRTDDVKTSLMTTAFICFGLSIFLKMVGMLHNNVLIISLVASALMIAFTFKKD